MSEDTPEYGTLVEREPREVVALEAISRAEIDMQIATAKKYPRDVALVRKGIESMATLDQETAECCFHRIPRGGKTIEGPSVRLAEIAVHQFGNIRVQTRVLETETTGKTPHVTVQAVCADLEKNVAVSMEKRRRIVGKKSKGGVIDEDDINLAVNSCAAIAFRDAAFKVIPGALVKPALDAAKRVAIGDAKTLETRRADAITRFAKMGVTEKRILSALGKSSVDAIDLADLETLFGLFTAIRDGQTTIEEAFPVATEQKLGAAGLAERIAKKEEPEDNIPFGETAEPAAAAPVAEPMPEPVADDADKKSDIIAKLVKIRTKMGPIAFAAIRAAAGFNHSHLDAGTVVELVKLLESCGKK